MSEIAEPEDNLSEDELLRQERTAACPLKNCPQHLDDEMVLRCIRSNRLLCMECAVRTPTGYIAKEVARVHDDKFYKGGTQDYVIAALVCGVGMLIATALLKQQELLSLFFISLFVGPIVGTGLTEFTLRLTARRRGRYSDAIGAGSALVGGFLGALITVFLRTSQFNAEMLSDFPEEMRETLINENPELFADPLAAAFELTFTDIGLLIFIGFAAVSVYARFKVRI